MIFPEAVLSRDGKARDILKENSAGIGALKKPLWLTACVNCCLSYNVTTSLCYSFIWVLGAILCNNEAQFQQCIGGQEHALFSFFNFFYYYFFALVS